MTLILTQDELFVLTDKLTHTKCWLHILSFFTHNCLEELTSLLRTARKQPLVSSEGSNMKKLSFFSRPSSFLNMLDGDGRLLD